MARILMVFVDYQEVYKGSRDKFIKHCENIKSEKRLIIVRNDREEGYCAGKNKNDWIFEIGGDNSVYEFSGWDKGWRSEPARSFDADVYLFANSAFVKKGFYATPVVSDDIIDLISDVDIMCGNLRHFAFPVMCGGMDLRDYVSTHFFFMSKKVMHALGTLVSERSYGRFIKEDFSEDLLTDNEVWNEKFKKYVMLAITSKYHTKGKKIEPGQYEFLKRKILCIMNELLLSGRVKKAGFGLKDITPLPGFLNSYYIIFAGGTTVLPFQFLRKTILAGMEGFFINGILGRTSAGSRFYRFLSGNIVKRLSRD